MQKTNLFGRTPSMQALKEALSLANQANKLDISVNDLIERLEQDRWSRRTILKSGLIFGVGSLIPSISFMGCQKAVLSSANIGIVGAGIAGLNCAYQLKKLNKDAIVYEASSRFGGRMYTRSGFVGAGLTSELGGEFVDTGHLDMIELANEFGIKLLDTKTDSEKALISNALRFGGQNYTIAQLATEFQAFSATMQADIDALPEDVSYNSAAQIAAWDNKSISQYLDGIGATGAIRKFIEVAYTTEFGLDTSELSALTLLTLISTDTSNSEIEIYGESDERFRIDGGSNAITDSLAEACSDRILSNHQLIRIDEKSNGSGYTLHFDIGGNTKTVDYPIVVLAIPFTVLRNVEINVAMSTEKKFAIDNLSYGKNAKLLMGFNERIWRTQGYAGYTYSDTALQNGWDHTQMQNNNQGAGGFTIFTGGMESTNLSLGTPESQMQKYLPLIEEMYPGATANSMNKAERMLWMNYKYSLGSYPAFTVGQYQTIAGREIEPVGNIFFAGDHCNLDFQGYMNGGAKSGKEVAIEINKL